VSLKLFPSEGRSLDVFDLLNDENRILQLTGRKVWVLFDKIDELFPQDREARRAALEGLMVAVMSIRRAFPLIEPKVFLRSDLWAELSFTNKSHLLDKTISLTWSRRQIAALLAKGAAVNSDIRARMLASEPTFESTAVENQTNEALKHALHPVISPTVRHRRNDYETIAYMYDRIRDARQNAFPREAILWANWAVDLERRSAGRGVPGDGDSLVSGRALVSAYAKVSNARCESYLSEFPLFADHFARFEGQVGPVFTRRELDGLMAGLSPSGSDAYKALFEIGMLTPLGASAARADRFEVPMLYRHGLGLSTPERT
jgi:hypothetical protein